MIPWKRATWYVQYLSRARSPVRIRSQVVSDLLQRTLPHRSSQAGLHVRDLQRRLRSRQDTIAYQDLGAGTWDRGPALVERRVGDLATRSSRTWREGEFLHRICRELRPRAALELGTHLGLSALYQGTAMPRARFVTVEGIDAIARVARSNWDEFGLQPQPELVVGDFDEVLPRLLDGGFRPDYVLLDGNHAYEPTLRYTRQLIDAGASGPDLRVLVLDDIYWSDGMRRAWDEVRSWPEVAISVDLFRFGLLFLGDLGAKEHAVVRW